MESYLNGVKRNETNKAPQGKLPKVSFASVPIMGGEGGVGQPFQSNT